MKVPQRRLLGVQNAKTTKGEKLGYLTGIMYLAPANTIEGINTCPYASKGCKKACLYTAGRGKFNNVQNARISKTELFRDNLNEFMHTLYHDIKRLVKRAEKLNMNACVRLNGTSDIEWEKIKHNGKNIFEIFPNVQFYDYTKNPFRFQKKLPNNYHLTYSRSENKFSQKWTKTLLKQGHNVAVVFNNVPTEYLGHEVINGDDHDLRFLDKKGVVVGLTAKGEAKKDKSGFVEQLTIDGFKTLTLTDINLKMLG